MIRMSQVAKLMHGTSMEDEDCDGDDVERARLARQQTVQRFGGRPAANGRAFRVLMDTSADESGAPVETPVQEREAAPRAAAPQPFLDYSHGFDQVAVVRVHEFRLRSYSATSA